MLGNFYNTAYHLYSEQINFNNQRFPETITEPETNILHFAIKSPSL
ncbi:MULTISPECIES: DUF2290 domain-containing protein [unclassified Microcystis]|nr:MULTISPECIES: DUF2290 domain-containing protein [unclassified Microcystis]